MNAARICNRYLVGAAFLILAVPSPAGTSTRQTRRPAESPLSQTARATLNSDYGKLPLAFEPNRGQTDARVRFLARGGGMMAFFTDTETAMVLRRSRQAKTPDGPRRSEAVAGEVEQAVVRMKLAGAGQPRRVIGLDKLESISNYFIGNDREKWHADVPHYARIEYEGVYPGIDLVWYGNQRQLEYDFVVGPGADPKQIQVAYEGVESVEVEAGGELVLRTALGEVRQQRPRVYQEIGGKRMEVGARYAIAARNRVSFELAKYDRKRELRIDPVVLVYSTYLGGSGLEQVGGIAVDAAGSAYVTGYTNSTDFPTQSPYHATYQGGTEDVFVTKLTPAGNALVYSTYLGGSGEDEGYGIAVDAAGSAYVTGYTTSTTFPTLSAYQATDQGGTDAFVTKLSPAGNALVYSTYLGGNGVDWSYGIALDGAGSAYVTGYTTSTNFPTQSAYQAAFLGGRDAFVTKLTPAGTALAYSTYLGGSGYDEGYAIAVDGADSVYVTGFTSSTDFPTQSPYQASQGGGDAFVTKLTPAGTALAYSTYLGGSADDEGDAIAVDAAGSAYVTGLTYSTDFPTESPYQATLQGNDDVFVTKLTPAGNALAYSTYLGGRGLEGAKGIAVDAAGSAYIAGQTSSTNFPTTQSAYQAAYQGGTSDAFVTKLAPPGNALVYSTYLGGSGGDAGSGIALDASGSAYVAGQTHSTNFPIRSPYQATLQGFADAFVTKLTLGLRFIPMTPCRVADTRNAAGPFGGPAIAGGASRAFNLPSGACAVPSTAQAYSLNVTVVPAGRLGYLTLWPAGQAQPLASTLNSLDGRIKSNAAIVPAGTGGSVSVFATDATQVVLDINGYFVPATDPTGLAFYPLTPCRIADTRKATAPLGGPSLASGQSRTFPILSSTCNVPVAAEAYSLNFTAVPGGSPLGYLTTWPTGHTMPLASNLNAPTGTVVANAAIVQAGTGGSVDVFASNTTHLVIDINGYFAPMATGGLSLYNVTPCRVVDTRRPSGSPPVTSLNVAVTSSACGIPATAQADAFSVTVVPPGSMGYLTLWPQGQSMPVVSTLNALDGAITSNMAIVPAAETAISAFASNPTHLILDISGYFGE